MTERAESIKTDKINTEQPSLAWMDIEMSGLDPEVNTILEIATVITDYNLEIISDGPVIAIYQTDEVLETMDEWNKKCHGETGLIDRVRQSTYNMKNAEILTIDFIKRYIAPKKSPLCGNSIWQDRRFLIKYMPTLENYFHYRNIDVSSVKELYTRWYPDSPAFEKENNHTAVKDIYESISELKYYRSKIFIK
jgi:oligoribonuclease